MNFELDNSLLITNAASALAGVLITTVVGFVISCLKKAFTPVELPISPEVKAIIDKTFDTEGWVLESENHLTTPYSGNYVQVHLCLNDKNVLGVSNYHSNSVPVAINVTEKKELIRAAKSLLIRVKERNRKRLLSEASAAIGGIKNEA